MPAVLEDKGIERSARKCIMLSQMVDAAGKCTSGAGVKMAPAVMPHNFTTNSIFLVL